MKLAHMKVAERHWKKHSWLSTIIIVLTPLSSVVSGIQVILYPESETTLPIVVTILTMVLSILSMLLKKSRFEELKTEHTKAAREWEALESIIRKALILPRDGREDPIAFLNGVQAFVRALQIESPMIPNHVLKEVGLGALKKAEIYIHQEPENTDNPSCSMERLLYDIPTLRKYLDKNLSLSYELGRSNGVYDKPK